MLGFNPVGLETLQSSVTNVELMAVHVASPCNQLIKIPVEHLQKNLNTESWLRTETPADNHMPTGSGQGGNYATVQMMDVRH